MTFHDESCSLILYAVPHRRHSLTLEEVTAEDVHTYAAEVERYFAALVADAAAEGIPLKVDRTTAAPIVWSALTPAHRAWVEAQPDFWEWLL